MEPASRTRWTKKVAPGDPAEHVYVEHDGHGNWGVVRSWVFPSGDVAYAWALSLIGREGWVEYGADRTGTAG